MLHFILTLKDGSKHTLTAEDIRNAIYIDAGDLTKDPTEWCAPEKWQQLVEADDAVTVKVIDDGFAADVKKLSKVGKEALANLLSGMSPDFDDVTEQDAKILRVYTLELTGEVPQELIENEVALENASKLITELSQARPGDKEEIYSRTQGLIRQLLRRNQITIHDDLFKRFAEVAKNTIVKGNFESFEEIEILNDQKTKPEEKAKLINSGISLHRIPEEVLTKDVVAHLSDETKERLVEESRYSASMIRTLKYFSKTLFKGALETYSVQEESWIAITENYKPTPQEMKRMSADSNAFRALLDIGYITKDTVTDEMIGSDPEFFMGLPWFKKDEKFLIRAIKNARYSLSNIAESVLQSGNAKVEAAFIAAAGKPLLAINMSLLSAEGKKKAKEVLLADLKSSEAAIVLQGLDGMLGEKEQEKIEKLAVKTVDGAIETLTNSSNVNLRKLAITRLLGSDAQRNDVIGLKEHYKFTDEEVERISEYVKKQDFSLYQLVKVSSRILLGDQAAFRPQLLKLASASFVHRSDYSVYNGINDDIFAEAINAGGVQIVRTILREIEELTPEKVGRILSLVDFDLSNFIEVADLKKELTAANKTLPRGKKLKGLDLLTGKPTSFTIPTAVHLATSRDNDNATTAIEWIMTQDPKDFDIQDLARVSRNLYDAEAAKFVNWAKGNVEFFAQQVTNDGHIVEDLISTEEEMKRAIFLIRSSNEHNSYADRRLIRIAAEKFPAMALSNKELLGSKDMTPDNIFEEVLNRSPEAIDLNSNKEMIVKVLNASGKINRTDDFLETVAKLNGTPKEKANLVLEMYGDEAEDAVVAMLSHEEMSQVIKPIARELMAQAKVNVGSLLYTKKTAEWVNDISVSVEDLKNVTRSQLKTLYTECPNHRDTAFSVAYDEAIKSNELGSWFGDNELVERIIAKIPVEILVKMHDFNRTVLMSLEEGFSEETVQKVKQAASLVPAGAAVKAKISKIDGEIVVKVTNNEEIENQFGGELYKDSIACSVPLERALNLMSSKDVLEVNGVTKHVNGAPKLLLDFDEAQAKDIVKNGNKEINEIAKEKSAKLIAERDLLSAFNPKRKWTLSVVLDRNGNGNYPIGEATLAVKKGLSDTHNQTKSSSEVKDSPLLVKHQKDVWGLPRFRSSGRYRSSFKSNKTPGEILSPIYTGSSGVGEVSNVLTRLTENVDISTVELKISVSDIRGFDYESFTGIHQIMEELEPVLVLSGAFSGGNQVWGHDVMDSITAQHDQNSEEIKILLSGRFSKGDGIAKTLGAILGVIEHSLSALAQKKKAILDGEINAATELREIVEKNLDMKAVMRSGLMLKTLAGQKMLFSA